jgi:hypothetical protein
MIQGLTPRALAAWAGTDRLSALPPRLDALASPAPVPAATTLALFVAGARIERDRIRGLDVDALVAAGLLDVIDGLVHAPAAIVPLARSLIVCDHHDALDHEDLVAWPDDSSYHLAGALPAGRRARWIDLGCGSAFAQLARPELADTLVGVDRNPRAVRYARLGAELSQIPRFEAIEADLAALAIEPAELVTCNAPIPGTWDRAIWRSAPPAFFEHLWPAIRRHLAPGGLAVVHAKTAAIPDDLAGERVVVAYADFAVLWWRPDATPCHVHRERLLTDDRPHVDAADRDAALC